MHPEEFQIHFHSILKTSTVNLIEKVLPPHFTCEETEAQGDCIVFPKLIHGVSLVLETSTYIP